LITSDSAQIAIAGMLSTSAFSTAGEVGRETADDPAGAESGMRVQPGGLDRAEQPAAQVVDDLRAQPCVQPVAPEPGGRRDQHRHHRPCEDRDDESGALLPDHLINEELHAQRHHRVVGGVDHEADGELRHERPVPRDQAAEGLKHRAGRHRSIASARDGAVSGPRSFTAARTGR